MEAKKRN